MDQLRTSITAVHWIQYHTWECTLVRWEYWHLALHSEPQHSAAHTAAYRMKGNDQQFIRE